MSATDPGKHEEAPAPTVHPQGEEKTPRRAQRRSRCPVACALDIIGDRWTLLIIRDLVRGCTRFREFMESPEGIPSNILTERLQRLTQHGIIETVPVRPGAARLSYNLTPKGQALLPALRALKEWGLQWEADTTVDLS
ncbi:MAG: winged helix-turn-helix transcriptional regulator, partial [Candidatus Methylacidiphilales bacterium]|nr:helix-turn-helix domain-containing protein [Candidatus Methylacidiphilales bacterium]